MLIKAKDTRLTNNTICLQDISRIRKGAYSFVLQRQSETVLEHKTLFAPSSSFVETCALKAQEAGFRHVAAELLDITRTGSAASESTARKTSDGSVADSDRNYSDKYECPEPNCRKRKTVYYSIQLRSGDEPASLALECVECGKKWVIH
jgi:DNA-directed RNA polymerase subunit M/transcription elongation factor TFIIS